MIPQPHPSLELTSILTTYQVTFQFPIINDIVVIIMDSIMLLLLFIKLQFGILLQQNQGWRIGWGIISMGLMWQIIMCICRIMHYRLPDVMFSGWMLLHIGLFVAMLSTINFMRQSKPKSKPEA